MISLKSENRIHRSGISYWSKKKSMKLLVKLDKSFAGFLIYNDAM